MEHAPYTQAERESGALSYPEYATELHRGDTVDELVRKEVLWKT